MKNKYNQMMEKICVTQEMEERILIKLAQIEADYGQGIVSCSTPSIKLWKTIAQLAACLVVIICCAAIIPNLTDRTESPLDSALPPSIESMDLDQLADSFDFTLYVPTILPENYKLKDSSNLFGDMAEITYSDGINELTYRMASGTDDISGDYNQYSDVQTVKYNNKEFTIKGSDEKYMQVIWNDGEHAFSIYSSTPLAKDILLKTADSIKPYEISDK